MEALVNNTVARILALADKGYRGDDAPARSQA
jgi:hypothetical protein